MRAKVVYSMRMMLSALVMAMLTKARSLRAVEQPAEQMARKGSSPAGINHRIADNTLGELLCRLKRRHLTMCLHRLVKAEHRRGNLKPDRLPFGVAAIDGKHVATLHWHDLCRVLGLEQDTATTDQVRKSLSERYPMAQLCDSTETKPYALIRTHTVTLVSASAAVCIHQRPIAGHSNEIGSMGPLLSELKTAYGRTGLFQAVTTDAGNTSLAVMTQMIGQNLDYFGRVKDERLELYQEAYGRLGQRRPCRAVATETDTQNGAVVTYHLWRYDLSEQGWLDWTHARQLIRVRRTVEHKVTGKTTVGNRYWVTSLVPDRLGPKQTLVLARAHWRCEDENHWTLDTQLGEDKRRLAWSRHPQGVLAVTALRAMALAILAVARRLSRHGYSQETPSWDQVAEHFLLLLCDTVLVTEAFDTV